MRARQPMGLMGVAISVIGGKVRSQCQVDRLGPACLRGGVAPCPALEPGLLEIIAGPAEKGILVRFEALERVPSRCRCPHPRDLPGARIGPAGIGDIHHRQLRFAARCRERDHRLSDQSEARGERLTARQRPIGWISAHRIGSVGAPDPHQTTLPDRLGRRLYLRRIAVKSHQLHGVHMPLEEPRDRQVRRSQPAQHVEAGNGAQDLDTQPRSAMLERKRRHEQPKPSQNRDIVGNVGTTGIDSTCPCGNDIKIVGHASRSGFSVHTAAL